MAENKQVDGEKRQTRLNLRLTNAEHAMLKSRAEGFGLPMAEFVRVFLLELPKPAKRVHDLPMVDPKLLRQLVSIGNNVNQLTRYAHTVSNDPKQTLDVLSLSFALQKLGDELAQLREQYSLKSVKEVDTCVSDAPVLDTAIDTADVINRDERC